MDSQPEQYRRQWGYVDERQIESIVANHALTVLAASRALLDRALDASGHDNIGIELARLSVASPFASPLLQRRPRFMEILAVCLLAFVGLGALIALGLRQHWLYALRHLR
ncbi:MAG TPA: hypothetical protein VGT08_20975 [Terracidiphilus sp.]|nr:hypothetical protein [Terracidiphilus sp.]